MRRDVMLDLETLSLKPNAVVAAVGAVFFNPETDELGETFIRTCSDMNVQQQLGRHLDAETAVWWMGQSRTAQDATFLEKRHQRTTVTVLTDFVSFLGPETDEVRMWGNGAAFDNVVLETLFEAYGIRTPWKFYNNSCYRTMKNLGFERSFIPQGERTGTLHNALEDAISQARHLQRIMKAMRADSARLDYLTTTAQFTRAEVDALVANEETAPVIIEQIAA